MFSWLWHSSPQLLEQHSLSLSGHLHTTNLSPLPRTYFQSLKLSTRSLSEHLTLWYLVVVVQTVFAILSLSSFPSSVTALFSVALRYPSFSADLHVNWVAVQVVVSFPLSQFPLRNAGPVLIPHSLFLLFCFIHL